jgi:hypothetical protein
MVADMSKIDDMAVKRLLLAAVRTRFSPEIQKLKEDAIDGIVERILLTVGKGEYCSAQLVQRIFSETSGFHIAFNDIYSSLQRLFGQSRIEKAPKEVSDRKMKVKGEQRNLYKLNDAVRTEMEDDEKTAIRRFNAVVKRLFKDSERDSALYGEPFLKFLSTVFFRLASESVRSLLGESGEDGVVYSPIFKSALDSVGKELGVLNAEVFVNGVINFFQNNDPEYATIKWNLAQSYHSLRAIGLHEGGSILGGVLFKNAEFYLDTNVVIAALALEEEHHAGFVALRKACKKLGLQIKVCQITLEELKRTVDIQLDMLGKVVNQIPEETAVKVYCGFLDMYYKKMKNGEEVDFQRAFSSFYNAREILREQFEVDIEDNEWFDEEGNTKETKGFAEIIKKRYAHMSRSNKGENASVHDSLCIRWIDERRKESGNNNVWFLTRDHTLPGCVPEGCDKKSLSIHLDGVLQWLAPIAVGEGDEVDLELAYSKMLVSRILPQERIFALEDFLIFHELNMACKELPAKDVEGCIQSIKIRAPLLNPTIPADRERLAHEISAYFADPKRKFKQEIIGYEAKVSELSGDLEGVRSDLAKEKEKSLKGAAWLRASVVGIVLILGESVTIILALFLGVGENPFQKIVSSWPIITAVAVACIGFGGLFIGKERIKELGWPFNRIFK